MIASKVRACLTTIVSFVGMSFFTPAAQASNVYYANWTADTLSGVSAGSVSGAIATGQGSVNVTYSGDVAFWTQTNNIGNDYYTAFESIYTNSVVSNGPSNVDVIALSESPAYTDTITFSAPVTNVILDIVSLGQAGMPVSYNFNATPVILSQGPSFWGGCGTCLSVSGNMLTGSEGDGAVEFAGIYTSISWTTTGAEAWNGFTVGVTGLAASNSEATAAAPEPATWTGLLIAAALFMPYLGRRKSRRV